MTIINQPIRFTSIFWSFCRVLEFAVFYIKNDDIAFHFSHNEKLRGTQQNYS